MSPSAQQESNLDAGVTPANDPYGLSLGANAAGCSSVSGGKQFSSSSLGAAGTGGALAMSSNTATTYVDPEQRTFEAMNRDGELDLGRWVVVFGFTPGDYVSPVRALQQHGAITRHCLGGGSAGGRRNYLFVQVRQMPCF
jgi:hypothetical protein